MATYYLGIIFNLNERIKLTFNAFRNGIIPVTLSNPDVVNIYGAFHIARTTGTNNIFYTFKMMYTGLARRRVE